MNDDAPLRPGRLSQTLSEWVRVGLASLLTLGSIAWAFDLYSAVGLRIYNAQFYGAILALALPLGFIALPARRGTARGRIPWYDWLAALIGFSCVAYLVWRYQDLVDLILLRPPDAVSVGWVLIVLSLEALRRSTGKALPIICIVFILYALTGHVLPGRMAAQVTDWQKLAAYLVLDTNGILGLPLAVAASIVIAFLFFGQLLNRTGGSTFFTDLALLGMGRLRGGPAKVAVVASALFGSISGSAVANVVATGVVTIPMIRRAGYARHRAAAIEAVSSTGGQLMPPVMGASAFLMAEFLTIPYADVVLAALVPGLLYYVALFIQADLEAVKLGAERLEEEALPARRHVLAGAYFILPFVALITALFTYRQSPQLSALIACAVLAVPAVLFGYAGKRPRLRTLLGAIPGAGMAALDIILVCVGAGIVIGILAISGLSFNLTLVLVQIGENNLPVLILLAAVVCIVLGMGLPTVGVYVLLAALVAPALVEVGVAPIAEHLYVMYFGMMSMITPPVAIAAFAAAGLADADPMRTGWAAVQFGWMAYVIPVLFVLSPTLVLIGGAGEIALAIVTAAAGIWLVSIALSGFLVRTVAPVLRLAFGLAGLLALIPAGAFEGALYTDIAGVAAGALLVAREYWITQKAPPEPVRSAEGSRR